MIAKDSAKEKDIQNLIESLRLVEANRGGYVIYTFKSGTELIVGYSGNPPLSG